MRFRRSRRPPLYARSEEEFYRLRLRLMVTLSLVAAVTLTGVIGYWIIGGPTYSLLDALYMTVVTLTTVGFKEIIDLTGNPAGRIFTMLLLVAGVGIVLYSIPVIAAFFIEGHLKHFFAIRRMERKIQRLDRHYIVCGDVRTAWHVCEELKNTTSNFVIVAPTEELLGAALARVPGAYALAGDPTDDQVLIAAGIERADGVVVCMANDKDGVLAALTARRLAPGARIVASSELKESEGKFRMAGADAVVRPSEIGGRRLASELIRPHLMSFVDHVTRKPDTDLWVQEVRIHERGRWAGETIGSLRFGEMENAILVAAREKDGGKFEFMPSPDRVVEPGMVLIFMTDTKGKDRLEAGSSMPRG